MPKRRELGGRYSPLSAVTGVVAAWALYRLQMHKVAQSPNALRTATAQENELAQAFRRAIEDCKQESSIEASLSVIGDAKELHPVVRDEVCWIGCEAIRNACQPVLVPDTRQT